MYNALLVHRAATQMHEIVQITSIIEVTQLTQKFN